MVSELIQTILAPGIMISACGLLILGANNKYSIVVNRIRVLDEEKRKLKWNKNDNEMTEKEALRLQNIRQQIHLLYPRIKFVRNAVLSYSISVSLFVLTSILIGFASLVAEKLSDFALVTFMAGMLSVFLGSFFMAKEVIWGYKIVTLEVDSV